MTNEEYVQAALRTESLSDEVRRKFRDPHNIAMMAEAMKGTMNWIRIVDALKKFMFYDKHSPVITPMQREAKLDLAALATSQPVVKDDPTIRLLHSMMGMLTEAGELMEALVQEVRMAAGQGAGQGLEAGPGQELDRVNLIEEIGDVFWYQAIAVDVLKTSFAEIQERNIAKLKARYPGKFENQRAVERDLEREREALTSTRASDRER